MAENKLKESSLFKNIKNNNNELISSNFYSKTDIIELANNLKFCGPSPDEIALLLAAKNNFKFFFTGADSEKVIIQTLNLKFEVQKLIINGFESVRKMMSVLIKYKGQGNNKIN